MAYVQVHWRIWFLEYFQNIFLPKVILNFSFFSTKDTCSQIKKYKRQWQFHQRKHLHEQTQMQMQRQREKNRERWRKQNLIAFLPNLKGSILQRSSERIKAFCRYQLKLIIIKEHSYNRKNILIRIFQRNRTNREPISLSLFSLCLCLYTHTHTHTHTYTW